MEQQTYTFGDKEYTRSQLIAFGKAHYPKFYLITRYVGLGVFGLFGIICGMFAAMGYSFAKAWERDIGESAAGSGVEVFYIYAVVFGVFAFVGLIVFFISFAPIPEEKCLKHAIDYYNKAELNKQRAEARQAANVKKDENANLNKLLKYKELLDAGIITQEEFEEKKKELLG